MIALGPHFCLIFFLGLFLNSFFFKSKEVFSEQICTKKLKLKQTRIQTLFYSLYKTITLMKCWAQPQVGVKRRCEVFWGCSLSDNIKVKKY